MNVVFFILSKCFSNFSTSGMRSSAIDFDVRTDFVLNPPDRSILWTGLVAHLPFNFFPFHSITFLGMDHEVLMFYVLCLCICIRYQFYFMESNRIELN